MGKPYDVKDVEYVKNEYEENERQISRRWWQRIIIQQHWKHFEICKRIVIDIYVFYFVALPIGVLVCTTLCLKILKDTPEKFLNNAVKCFRFK